MPWKCPACGTLIRRELTAAGDYQPRPGQVYRCGICRLDLVVSEDGAKMIVAPLSDATDRLRQTK